MILVDELKTKLRQAQKAFEDCKAAINVEELEKKLKAFTIAQEDSNLYKDAKKAQEVLSGAKHIEKQLLAVQGLKSKLGEIGEFIELLESEGASEDLTNEVNLSLNLLQAELDALYIASLLSGEYDTKNAILSLHAGAGGTEAQDWVQMLYRLYKMYAANNGFNVEELDYLAGDEAGIKSVTFRVAGINAYGYLKAEKGVHRLVRISPFDSNARRHTSFASLEVMPEIEYDTSVDIKDEDLKIDTYRSSGAGGQHVNKTESAVRITHLPSGIVTQCQNGRSQIQNRETAFKMLVSKLIEKRISENQEKAGAISGELKKIEWGSQIRSYVFQPYTMVKDHRTNAENTDVASVMNGKIEGFIFEYLRKSRVVN